MDEGITRVFQHPLPPAPHLSAFVSNSSRLEQILAATHIVFADELEADPARLARVEWNLAPGNGESSRKTPFEFCARRAVDSRAAGRGSCAFRCTLSSVCRDPADACDAEHKHACAIDARYGDPGASRLCSHTGNPPEPARRVDRLRARACSRKTNIRRVRRERNSRYSGRPGRSAVSRCGRDRPDTRSANGNISSSPITRVS